MTVSTSVGRQRTVGQIVKLAYQSVGLLHASQLPDTSDRELGRQLLESILDTLQAYGPMARAVSLYNLAVVADTYRYDLPAYAIETIGDGAWIDHTVTDLTRAPSETSLKRISRESWQSLSTKAATSSRPSMYYTRMDTDPKQAWLWPIPSESGTVRLQIHRALADADADAASVDLENYWTEYLIAALAAALASAKSLPEATIARKRDEAQGRDGKGGLLQLARAMAAQDMPNQIALDHRISQ
jgi:hypothetical protein